MTCCVTGHRSEKFPFSRGNDYMMGLYNRQLDREIGRLIDEGYHHFISGMAEGADLDFAVKILYARSIEGANITFEGALPFQPSPFERKTEYTILRDQLLPMCDRVTTVSPSYDKFCYQKRNIYMVDHSDLVLAIWNGVRSGGTWNTIRYATQCGKPIRYIMLNELG